MTTPLLKAHLPELVAFSQQLAIDRKSGIITGWRDFIGRVHTFYTPPQMAQIECVVPGWGVMASYAEQQTLIHVTSVLTALYLLPEFQQATADSQALMEWTVLFHDVAKMAQSGKHDYIHAFRSAAITGKALAGAGFPTSAAYPTAIAGWYNLTYDAVILNAHHGEAIQDNSKLPAIVTGIEDLYGVDAPAGLVIKGVLLHLSIANDPGYPTVAPLTDAEIKQHVDANLFPILKMMMLVDTDAWNIFDRENQQRQRQQTLDEFERISRLIRLNAPTEPTLS